MPPKQSSISTTQDEQAIRSLVEQWVEIGLNPENASEEQIAKFYDNNSNPVVLYNSADTGRQIANSVEEYSKSWSYFLQNNEILDRKLHKIHQVVVEGDLATSIFNTELVVMEAHPGWLENYS